MIWVKKQIAETGIQTSFHDFPCSSSSYFHLFTILIYTLLKSLVSSVLFWKFETRTSRLSRHIFMSCLSCRGALRLERAVVPDLRGSVWELRISSLRFKHCLKNNVWTTIKHLKPETLSKSCSIISSKHQPWTLKELGGNKKKEWYCWWLKSCTTWDV